MKKTEFKTKVFSITLILAMIISAVLIVVPVISAQEYDHVKATFAYIGATPNPVGVGQQVLFHVGITDFLRDVDDGWVGLTVSVTKPDGSTETLGPYRTDSTGGTGAVFVPEMVGTYQIQTHFPEQSYFWTPNNRVPFQGNVLYEASESDVLTLVVNEDPLDFFPQMPLPEEYWTRPIDSQLREWSSIAGNWLEGAGRGGVFAPANDGPDTAHVIWTTPIDDGGLVGGILGEHSMEDGDAYWGKFTDSVIVSGIFFYNEYSTGFTAPIGVHKVSAIDVRTGEKLWSRVLGDNERVSFGQLLLWDTFNYHGVFPYIWTTPGGGTYNAYDPLTGEWEYTMENVPRGTRTFGENGEILIYDIDTQGGYMTLWNSSNIPALYNGQTDPSDPNYGEPGYGGFGWGSWYYRGKTVDATGDVTVYPNQPLGKAGYSWNVSIPANLGGTTRFIAENKVIGVEVTRTEVNSWALSLEPGHEGELIFQNTWQPPDIWESGTLDVSLALPLTTAAFEADSFLESDVFVIWAKELRKYYGFSASTGEFLWETDPAPYLDIYVGTNRAMAYGNFYSCGYGGVISSYDTTTGNLKWSYAATDDEYEILWGNNWPLRIQFITDGKIYVGMEEHSSVDPKPRGAPYICLNAETGDLIWRANGLFRQNHWGGNSIIGDSVIVGMDAYTQLILAIGKGPSATTTSIRNDVIELGNSALITGMVTDTSPGTKDASLQMRFPDGVPAVSDADMSEWMKYVYKQFPRPEDVSGVSVRLEAIDPNGNYQNLGTVMTDSFGFYSHSFTPEIEGNYKIMATFDGSGAYYGSFAETALSVDAAGPTTPIVPEEPATEAIISTEVAIIAAVAVTAIIGVAAYLILRKRE